MHSRSRWLMTRARWVPWPTILVGGAVAAVLFAHGGVVRGSVVLGAVGVAVALASIGVDVVGALGRLSGEVVSWLGFGLVGAVVAVWGIPRRLVRRDPVTTRRARGGWATARRADPRSDRAFVTEGPEHQHPDRNERRLRPPRAVVRLTRLVGVVSVLLVLDLLVGLGVERVWPAKPVVVRDAVNLTGSTKTVHDPRQDLPAMANAPWRAELFREMQLTPGGYWPFTEYRPAFHGKWVNLTGWERRTYRPAGLDVSRAPVVWMFGGSTTWGEAQRDGYTIASYLGRLAEKAGTPIVVRNFGQRGGPISRR
ncbi:MAG: hypothetical protein R2698_02170 [Microthrixaceae bacterium]